MTGQEKGDHMNRFDCIYIYHWVWNMGYHI